MMRRIFGSSWESRKFRAVVWDTLVSLALFATAHLGTPETVEAMTQVIAILQAPVALYIWGVAYEDGQAKSSPGQVQSVNVEAAPGEGH